MEQRTHKRLRRRTVPPAPPSPALIVGALAAAALIILAAGLMLGRCDAPATSAPTAPYASPYDWEAGLERDGDRLAYYEDGTLRSQLGVDVSDHQGYIDWQAVAADGVDFVFVRIGNRGYTEGALYADARGTENIDGATAAGLDVGAYFFSQATSEEEAAEEAEFALKLLDGRALALPVAYDHEPVSDAAGRANGIDRETLTACALAFCERFEAAGYATAVYGNKGDMARYDRAALGDRPVWFAEYDAEQPTAQFDFAVWQYTNAGSVAGISASVDLNLLLLGEKAGA
ncbi:GH25 family lysozyme [Arabiibacter massiliensis]|uniref:GH25 family lysozyme n=1 Tax=Arabiibacter massiliensis TaxID=1870985 RepID=UPI001E495EC5|nr:GH25 family lysozyme [Arabiibacter massiliensis]